VTTLREDLGPSAEGAGGGRPVPGPGQPGSRSVFAGVAGRLPALVRHHWIFTLALVAAVVPRVVTMLGFQPAVLFRLDTYDYLWGAVHLSPNVVNPSGYSLFLWLLRPFHSIVLVVALQHVLGLGIAIMVYVLLRRYGLPAWGATLAALPVLFDPAQLLIEQFIMADLLAMALMMGALTLLLIRRVPTLWRGVAAGLLMGASVTVRPTTLPLIILMPVYLLLRRAGWLRAGATLLAGLVPVLGYMSWFAAAHGSFNMSNSNGLFLWSRTMSFANCAVIKPPADLRALCPEVQPDGLAQPVGLRALPKRFLWNHDAWQWQPPSRSFVPDTAAFTTVNNQRALRFAVAAIKAQPFSYVSVIVRENLRPFAKTNNLRFPSYQPRTSTLDRIDRPYAVGAVVAYTGNTQGVAHDLGYDFGGRVQSPFATMIQKYQHIVFLPGPLFALIVLTGLGGLLLRRRRTLPAAFLWVSAVILMVLPTAEHEYTYRYVIPTVPLACIAAALALRKPPVPAAAGTAPAADGGALPEGGTGPAGNGPAESRATSKDATPPATPTARAEPGPAQEPATGADGETSSG
jgi:hypothetical protein